MGPDPFRKAMPRTWALALVLLVAVGAVVVLTLTTGDERASTRGDQALDESLPLAEPIDEAGLTDVDPPPALVPQVDLDYVNALSETEDSVAAAEHFALEFAHLMVDPSGPLDMDAVIDDVASEALPDEVRGFLQNTLDSSAEAALQRLWLVDRPSYIRSSATTAESPSQVQVEVTFHEMTALSDRVTWPVLRVDVSREGGRWLVSDLGSTAIDPLDQPQLAEELVLHLPGDGWREIPASK